MFAGWTAASKRFTRVLNTLGRQVPILVKLLHTTFNHVMSTFPNNDVTNVKRSLKMTNRIEDFGLKSVDKEYRSSATFRNLSATEMLLNYMEHYTERVFNAKQRAKLNVWLNLTV